MFWKKKFMIVRDDSYLRELIDNLYDEIDELNTSLRELREEVDYLISFVDEE